MRETTAPVRLATIDIQDQAASEQQQAEIRKIEQTLIKTVEDWASKWSSKDFDGYINAYSKTYKGNQPSHQAWVDYRRPRILRAGHIQVNLSNIHIKSRDAKSAIIDFDQSYQSANYRDMIRKRINLIHTDEGWKIQRERTLAVL